MPAPETLPIKRMEDLHTALIGRCEQGQFMIIETPPVSTNTEPHREAIKLYLVRYLFQSPGELISAKHVALPDSTSESVLQSEKARLLQEVEPFTFCDINVKPFECSIDGLTFGLIYSKETDSINLEPGPIITFMAPWDGEYYT